jgi:hypothetical protein
MMLKYPGNQAIAEEAKGGRDLMAGGKPLGVMFRLFGVFVGACGIVMLCLPLLGPGWHAIYGDSVSYGGWRVPVPGGFYVRKSGGSSAMWKLSLGIPLLNRPYGHISLFSLPPPRRPFEFERDYPGFAKRTGDLAAQSGYELKAQRTVAVGKTSAYCLEFARQVEEPRSLVRCALDNSVVVLFYEGDPRYVPEFFNVLGGMSQEIPASTNAAGNETGRVAPPFQVVRNPEGGAGGPSVQVIMNPEGGGWPTHRTRRKPKSQ